MYKLQKILRTLNNNDNCKFCNVCLNFHEGPIKYICDDCIFERCSRICEYGITEKGELVMPREQGDLIDYDGIWNAVPKVSNIKWRFNLAEQGLCLCGHCHRIKKIGYQIAGYSVCQNCHQRKSVFFGYGKYELVSFIEDENEYDIIINQKCYGQYYIKVIGEIYYCSSGGIYFIISGGKIIVGKTCLPDKPERVIVYQKGYTITIC